MTGSEMAPCPALRRWRYATRSTRRNGGYSLTWLAYTSWLQPGDNAWQLTAATLVGLMSVPGLAVLYGGVMQKRWSVNSMTMTFIGFSMTLIVWVLFAYEMGFGHAVSHAGSGIFGAHGFLGTF